MADTSRDDKILEGLDRLGAQVKSETETLSSNLTTLTADVSRLTGDVTQLTASMKALTGKLGGMTTSIVAVLGAMAIVGGLTVYVATGLNSISKDVGEIKGRQEAPNAVLQEMNETLKRIDDKISAAPEPLEPKDLGLNIAKDPNGFALVNVGVDGKKLPAIVATTKSFYSALMSEKFEGILKKDLSQGNIFFVSDDPSLTRAMQSVLEQK